MPAQAVAGPGPGAGAGQQAVLLVAGCLLPVAVAVVVVAVVEVVVVAVAAAAAAEGAAVSLVAAVPSADQPKPRRIIWEENLLKKLDLTQGDIMSQKHVSERTQGPGYHTFFSFAIRSARREAT